MNLDYLFFVATQESGRITAIAAIRTGPDGKVQAAYSSKTTITGLDATRGVLQGMQAELVTGMSAQYVVVSFFAEHDRPTLKRESERLGFKTEIFPGRTWISLSQLTWPLAFADLISERSLKEMCRYYKVEYNVKDAEEECKTLMKVFGILMRRYRTALIGEDAVSEVAGPTFEGLRKLVGI